MSLSDLTDDKTGLLKSLQHLSSLSPSNGNVFRLTQQIIELVMLVEMSHQLRLQVILNVVYEKVHDGFGNRVLDVLSDDQEVRLDQSLNDFAVSLFSRR